MLERGLEGRTALVALTPLGQAGRAEQIGDATLSLASTEGD